MEHVTKYIQTGNLTVEAYGQLKNRALLFLTNRFFYANVTCNQSREELAHDMVSHITTKLHLFDFRKASLGHFIWFVYRNYVIRKIDYFNKLKRKATTVSIDDLVATDDFDLLDVIAFKKSMERNVFASDDNEFISYCLLYWKSNLGRYFYHKQKQYHAAQRIIDVLLSGEKFPHKDFGAFLKYELGISRQVFHLVISRMRSVNRKLYKKWLEGELF